MAFFRQSRRQQEPRTQDEIVRDFNQLYYNGPDGVHLFTTTTWLGVPTQKCPTDVWIYQEIIWRTRPEVIVETGVNYGGSTLYLASLCDIIGQGEVVACDITLDHVAAQTRAHPRIRLFEGSSTAPEILAEIAEICRGKRTMVILDSDHSERHVADELRLYGPLVTPGCYMICEDTNVNGHPVYPEFGPGPYEAVQKFLREQGDAWRVDTNCERLLATFNPSGYLVRQ
jgi:cephalosporin hydroxylase